ncbi:hypothetical protein HXY33_03735 [Candidatus Bathyarchaeota archaeon]|nr:hypothetical protein [Candidatus Bathyarchaeota archaeon]
MRAKLAKILMVIIAVVLLVSLAPTNVQIAFSSENGGKIDVFTQKEPYSGKGLNMPSDAFGPEETVILYALVTFNEIPMQNALVVFYINASSGSSFVLTGRADINGIATVNFTIPTPPIDVDESEIFGTWNVLANVLIENTVFFDTLTFKVNWLVKLLSIRAIDESLIRRTSFGIGGDVGFEITLRSIAMTVKSITIAIVIQDELNVPVNYTEIHDFQVSPNEKVVIVYSKLYLPKWSHIGNATVYVSVLTAPVAEGGVPYCPDIYTWFFITITGSLKVSFHDAAVVNCTPSAKSVEAGQSFEVSATVQNEGTEIESFNVGAYYDEVLIGTSPLVLAPYSHVTLDFTLNTSLINPGNYTIKAAIPLLNNEADTADNIFVDGIIEIKSETPIIIHDIAISNITISSSNLYVGDLLLINVSIINKGTETEQFNVSAYYNSSIVETVHIEALAPTVQTTISFVWDTSFVDEGFYQISAIAPLSDDVNISDNICTDGVVEIRLPPPHTHELDILSNPISDVTFIINGVDARTPYSAILTEGVYTIVFPYEWVDSTTGKHYVFSQWEDFFTDPTRTFSLVSDMNLIAYYEETMYTLEISSSQGGTTGPSPGNYTYPYGISVTIWAFPHAAYEFDHWTLNGINRTENPITIFMDKDYALSARFEAVLFLTYRLSITSDPILSVEFKINGMNYTTPYSATLHEENYAITMPSSFRDFATGKLYAFDHWEDSSTNLERIVILNQNMSLVAYYEEAFAGWFIPEWFYLLLPPFLVLAILLIALLYRRRRRKEEESFYSGWTAWYYCRDMRNKLSRV